MALLLVPTVASAESLRLLDTLVLDYRGDNGNENEADDDYGLAFTKLYLTGEAEETSARAQVDGVYFFTDYPDVANPTSKNPSAHKSEARLERLSISHRVGDATITLGDFHKQLGRGMALSLRRVDELGVDKALRGGQLEWEGDTLSWNAFAGRTNISNLDGVTQKFLEDPEDTIAGASATLHLGTTDVTGYGLLVQPKTPTSPDVSDDRTLLGGGFVELPVADWLTLYGEGALSQYDVGGKGFSGTAAYATADVGLGAFNVLLEGLYLDQFYVQGSMDEVLFQKRTVYNQPPTLERIDQEVSDYENVQGGRVKLSRALFDGDLVLSVNGMFRRFGPETAYVDAVHGFGGFEFAYDGGRSRWFASGGYREQTQDGRAVKTMTHGETDWVQSLGSPWSLHFTVNHESRAQEDTLNAASGLKEYLRGTTLLGIEHGHTWSLTAEFGYDTWNENEQNEFYAGIFTYMPADWMNLRATVGSERGGIKCIGGVCREYPAFSGARVEATVQHDLL